MIYLLEPPGRKRKSGHTGFELSPSYGRISSNDWPNWPYWARALIQEKTRICISMSGCRITIPWPNKNHYYINH